MLSSNHDLLWIGIQFFEDEIRLRNRNPQRELHVHRMCAVDSKLVESVTNVVFDSYINEALMTWGTGPATQSRKSSSSVRKLSNSRKASNELTSSGVRKTSSEKNSLAETERRGSLKLASK